MNAEDHWDQAETYLEHAESLITETATDEERGVPDNRERKESIERSLRLAAAHHRAAQVAELRHIHRELVLLRAQTNNDPTVLGFSIPPFFS